MDTRTRIPPLEELPTPEEARQTGEAWVNRGKPCKHGHLAPYNIRHSYCRQCLYEQQNRYEVSDRGRDVQREAQKRYSASKKGRAFEQEYMHAYYQREDVKEAARQFARDYYQRPEVKARWKAMDAERRALEHSATPPWLTDDHRGEIKAIYSAANRREAETGIPHHVDHIIPLKHPDVCGLHVHWNLRVLTATENLSKSNSFDGTLDNDGWRV